MRGAGENQPSFKLVSPSCAQFGVALIKLRRGANNFFPDAAGLIDILVFQIKDRVYPMLARKGTKPILDSPSGEDGAVTSSRLPFQV